MSPYNAIGEIILSLTIRLDKTAMSWGDNIITYDKTAMSWGDNFIPYDKTAMKMKTQIFYMYMYTIEMLGIYNND